MVIYNLSRAKAPKPQRQRRTVIFQVSLLVAIVLFAILAVLAHTVAYFTFDVAITRHVQEFRAGWFDGLMHALSWIGFVPQVNTISFLILMFLYARGFSIGSASSISEEVISEPLLILRALLLSTNSPTPPAAK